VDHDLDGVGGPEVLVMGLRASPELAGLRCQLQGVRTERPRGRARPCLRRVHPRRQRRSHDHRHARLQYVSPFHRASS
jgi:hypothetical protein